MYFAYQDESKHLAAHWALTKRRLQNLAANWWAASPPSLGINRPWIAATFWQAQAQCPRIHHELVFVSCQRTDNT